MAGRAFKKWKDHRPSFDEMHAEDLKRRPRSVFIIIMVITIMVVIAIIVLRLTIQPHILHMARSAMVILLPTKNPVEPFSVMILSKAVRYLVDVCSS